VTEPTLEPIEDRLRRTFDERAEDMTPGDADDGELGAILASGRSAGEPSERRWLHWPSRPLLVAASLLVVALVAAGVAVVVGRNGDTSDQVAITGDCGDYEPCTSPNGSTVALVTAPRDLVDALETERDVASAQLLGLSELVELPVADSREARRRTDAAIAAFQAVVSGDPAGSVYEPAIDGLVGLSPLRTEVDDFPGTRDLQNVDYAIEHAGAYEPLITGVLDAQRAFVVTIDDPALRRGAELYQMGLRQRDLTPQLVLATLASLVNPGSSAVTTELSRLHAEVQQGQDALLAQATGTPYEEAAVTVVGEIEDSGLLDVVATALEGPINIADLLDAVELPADQGWPDFLDRVEQQLATAG
jgi:hypothetical protein